MFLAHQISIGHALSLLLISAGTVAVVTGRRTRARNERQAQLQHAAYELGRRVALDRTLAAAA